MFSTRAAASRMSSSVTSGIGISLVSLRFRVPGSRLVPGSRWFRVHGSRFTGGEGPPEFRLGLERTTPGTGTRTCHAAPATEHLACRTWHAAPGTLKPEPTWNLEP